MTHDALAGDRLIAMALLRPGWQLNYDGRPAIEPVVCIGKILSEQKLPDGKYNFLLQGLTRARIVEEYDGGLYRTARLHPLEITPTAEIDLIDSRRRLSEFFRSGFLASTDIGRQFQKVLASHLPTEQAADLIAFHLIDNAAIKQSLLAECDALRRIRSIVEILEKLRPSLESAFILKHNESMN